MVESPDKTWFTGEGNANQYSCFENPTNRMKNKKDMTLKDEPPRSIGVQHAAEEEWRNSSIRNEEAEPKQKLRSVMDVSGGESKARCLKNNIA